MVNKSKPRFVNISDPAVTCEIFEYVDHDQRGNRDHTKCRSAVKLSSTLFKTNVVIKSKTQTLLKFPVQPIISSSMKIKHTELLTTFLLN